MNHICSILLAAFSLAVFGCKAPDPGLVMSDLSEMLDKEVMVTTSQPVALSATDQPSKAGVTYDTARYLRAELKSVDPSGIVLSLDEKQVWIGRESIVAVVASD